MPKNQHRSASTGLVTGPTLGKSRMAATSILPCIADMRVSRPARVTPDRYVREEDRKRPAISLERARIARLKASSNQ